MFRSKFEVSCFAAALTAAALMACTTGPGDGSVSTESALGTDGGAPDTLDFAVDDDGGDVCFSVDLDENTDSAVLAAAVNDPNALVDAFANGQLRGRKKPCIKPPLENGITQGEVYQCAMAGLDAIRFREPEWKIINTFLAGLPCARDINDGTITSETAKKCLTAACQASKGIPLVDKLCLAWNGLMIIDKCFVLFVKYSASLLLPATLNRLLVGWDKEDCIVGPKGGTDRTTESCLLCCRDKYTTIEDTASGKLGDCQKYCGEWYAPMVK